MARPSDSRSRKPRLGWPAALALALVGAGAIGAAAILNNPGFPELAGRWHIARMVNISYKNSWYVVDGLNFEIDRRGLMRDPDGSAFSFVIARDACGAGCYGLIDNWNAVGHGYLMKMRPDVKPGAFRIDISDNSYFVIERTAPAS